MELALTLYHSCYLLRDAGGEGGRVPAETAGGINGSFHLYLIIRLQTLVDAGQQKD